MASRCFSLVACTICGMCSEHCLGHVADRAQNLYRQPPRSADPDDVPHSARGTGARCPIVNGKGGPAGRLDVPASLRQA